MIMVIPGVNDRLWTPWNVTESGDPDVVRPSSLDASWLSFCGERGERGECGKRLSLVASRHVVSRYCITG
jgi:hypothetical protein